MLTYQFWVCAWHIHCVIYNVCEYDKRRVLSLFSTIICCYNRVLCCFMNSTPTFLSIRHCVTSTCVSLACCPRDLAQTCRWEIGSMCEILFGLVRPADEGVWANMAERSVSVEVIFWTLKIEQEKRTVAFRHWRKSTGRLTSPLLLIRSRRDDI